MRRCATNMTPADQEHTASLKSKRPTCKASTTTPTYHSYNMTNSNYTASTDASASRFSRASRASSSGPTSRSQLVNSVVTVYICRACKATYSPPAGVTAYCTTEGCSNKGMAL